MLLRQWLLTLPTIYMKYRLFHGMTTRTHTQARWLEQSSISLKSKFPFNQRLLPPPENFVRRFFFARLALRFCAGLRAGLCAGFRAGLCVGLRAGLCAVCIPVCVRGCARGCARFAYRSVCRVVRGICELLRAGFCVGLCAVCVPVCARGCARGCVRGSVRVMSRDLYSLLRCFMRFCTADKRHLLSFYYDCDYLFTQFLCLCGLRVFRFCFTPKDAKTSVCGYAAHGG